MAEKKEPEKEKTVRIVWGSNESTPALYANHIQVSHAGETEFHITFGHLSPPLTFGLEEHELPEQLTVKPLVAIVTSPDVMKAFVRVLTDNLENFEKRKSEREQE
jgi:hypothetical protein